PYLPALADPAAEGQGAAMRRALAALVLSVGCGGANPPVEDVEPSEAKVLSVVSTELPESAEAQAMQALSHDAWRREHRFRDAAEPGYLFASTRVTQDEIEAGRWDPDELFGIGGQLFSLHFDRSLGFGGADLPMMGRFHTGARGGPDATRCASCHWRGGPAGAGDAADNAMLLSDGRSAALAIARNPPSLAGAGIRELIAREMTAELQALRADTVQFTADNDYAVTIDLVAKGVHFGTLTVYPDGEVDTTGVEGVDDDLVIRPFGWKGTFESIRDVSEDALNVHHGMQSEYLVATADSARIGEAGGDDPDGDGITEEILEGQVTALSLFIAMQEVPVELPPDDSMMLLSWARGRQDFETLGCATCHTPSLVLERPRFRLLSRQGGPTYAVELPTQGAQPRLAADPETEVYTVRAYSDFRRHKMGEELAEQRPLAGLPADEFITPPLWGIARSRPYLHDARAPTIEDAIVAHGGEAQASRDAFLALPELDRAPLRVFLASLTRAPRMVAE
ncbi:MAG: di-heme oxidoredictase family protein, partial [Myxococcota bacterium]